ncbi:MAG: hypothetical protein ACK4YM_00535 [Novosphingobium sp.]
MRGAVVLALAALLAGACKQERPALPPAPAGTPAPPATPRGDAPATLVGEWRVAGIDGQPVDAPIGIALTIGGQEIGFDPRCAGFTWGYTYSAGVLATKRRRQAAICAIGYDPVLDRLAGALDRVTIVRRTAANGIELSGGGRSVTLFSQ